MTRTVFKGWKSLLIVATLATGLTLLILLGLTPSQWLWWVLSVGFVVALTYGSSVPRPRGVVVIEIALAAGLGVVALTQPGRHWILPLIWLVDAVVFSRKRQRDREAAS